MTRERARRLWVRRAAERYSQTARPQAAEGLGRHQEGALSGDAPERRAGADDGEATGDAVQPGRPAAGIGPIAPAAKPAAASTPG